MFLRLYDGDADRWQDTMTSRNVGRYQTYGIFYLLGYVLDMFPDLLQLLLWRFYVFVLYVLVNETVKEFMDLLVWLWQTS
jgi:hypothetical protein